MLYQRGHLARPLDAVLSAASRLAVLRALLDAADGRSGRAVARLAGVNHQSAAGALKKLESLGVVESRTAGRRTLWRLRRRRWLVSELLLPLLARESEHASKLAALVKARLRGRCRAALLTGPAARGRLEPSQALSLLAVEGGGGRRPLAEALRGLKSELSERWGLSLESAIVPAREAASRAALDDAWRLLPDEGPGFAG